MIVMAGHVASRSRYGPERIAPSAEETRDLQGIARLIGADPAFLIQYLQSMRREAGSHAIVTRPQMNPETSEQLLARDLAQRIAGYEFGHGERVDLSRGNLIRSVAGWNRIIGDYTAHYAGSLTTAGLSREARRLGLDEHQLTRAFVAYALFRGNQRDAEIAVREASGGDERIAAWASAAGRYAHSTRHEDGTTEYWYRRTDVPSIRLAYMEASGARPMRTEPRRRAAPARVASAIEIIIRRQVNALGGSYDQVRLETERLLRARGPDRDRAIVEAMRSHDLDQRLAVGVLEAMENMRLGSFDSLARLQGERRTAFIRQLRTVGRYRA